MPAFRGAGKYRSGPCSPPTHRASAPREPCLPPGSSEALHSVAACVHGPIWICQVALAPTAVCARGMRAHCRPPVCAQSRSLHTSSSLFKSGGCGALDAVKAFISGAPPWVWRGSTAVLAPSDPHVQRLLALGRLRPRDLHVERNTAGIGVLRSVHDPHVRSSWPRAELYAAPLCSQGRAHRRSCVERQPTPLALAVRASTPAPGPARA